MRISSKVYACISVCLCQLSKLKSQSEQKRLEQERKHSAEMEELLEKVIMSGQRSQIGQGHCVCLCLTLTYL